MAIGDGANDIPMIEEAGLGIAIAPSRRSPRSPSADRPHGLDALLWAQGIPRSEWVEASAPDREAGMGASARRPRPRRRGFQKARPGAG